MPIRLTVIGGGPGGYTAAFAAARAGMSVTLVESGNLGGTCLNNGCIPTKTLKASADALELALRLSQFGITGQGAPAVDPAAVLARKEKVCSTLRGGLEKACASLGVRLLKGRGRLVHAGLVEASTAEGPVSVVGDRVILATGSGALELPGLPVDHTHILTSDDALALDRVPASIAIVGGGVIGCELAFIYQAFGSKVTVVEGQNRLLPLPSVDADMSALLQREMKKRRIGCELGRTLKDVRVEGGMVRAMLGASPFIKEPTPAQMKETPIEAETVLVTVGRAPNTAGLGLAEAGVAVDGRGWIRADEHMRTSLPGVYAVGDALGPSRIMLAHVAAAEGLCAVRDCLGHDGRMDYSAVPSGIFTSPEIGCVGLAEAQASEAGRDVRTATFQMRELGKAQAMSELPGMFKIVSDGATARCSAYISPGPMPRISSRKPGLPCVWARPSGTSPQPSTPTPPWRRACTKPRFPSSRLADEALGKGNSSEERGARFPPSQSPTLPFQRLSYLSNPSSRRSQKQVPFGLLRRSN